MVHIYIPIEKSDCGVLITTNNLQDFVDELERIETCTDDDPYVDFDWENNSLDVDYKIIALKNSEPENSNILVFEKEPQYEEIFDEEEYLADLVEQGMNDTIIMHETKTLFSLLRQGHTKIRCSPSGLL